MPQQVVKAVTTFTSLDSNVDNPSFTTHWEQTGSNATVNLTTVQARIAAFLNSLPTGSTNPMCYYISPVMSRAANAVMTEYYDVTGHLSGTPAGSPISIQYLQLGVAASFQGLYEGLSAIVSYRCDYATDVEFAPGTRPRSRDRNRFYLGPLSQIVIANDPTTKACFLAPAFTSDLLRSAAVLLAAGSGTTDVNDPVVWSRVGAVVKHPIVQIWTHKQTSYQRRRSDELVKVYS